MGVIAAGWWFGTFFRFSWEFHIPTDSYFFRGVGIPPTRLGQTSNFAGVLFSPPADDPRASKNPSPRSMAFGRKCCGSGEKKVSFMYISKNKYIHNHIYIYNHIYTYTWISNDVYIYIYILMYVCVCTILHIIVMFF